MNVLAIDSCGALGTVALARVGEGAAGGSCTVLGQTELAGKTYSARMMPAIRDLLLHHDVALASVGAMVVASGPGSFTGIRIGLATAKGLAEVNGIGLVAVSRLAVLAHLAQTEAAALDAGRGEFYLREESGERLVALEEFRERAAALGERLAVCEATVQAAAPGAVLTEPPTAADALRCGLARVRGGGFEDALTLDGNYLRRSDAEIFAQAAAREP